MSRSSPNASMHYPIYIRLLSNKQKFQQVAQVNIRYNLAAQFTSLIAQGTSLNLMEESFILR